MSTDINSLCDSLVGHTQNFDINVLYSICVLSEALTISDKIVLPRTIHNYFSTWDDKFCTDCSKIFISGDDINVGSIENIDISIHRNNQMPTVEELSELLIALQNDGTLAFSNTDESRVVKLTKDNVSSYLKQNNVELELDIEKAKLKKSKLKLKNSKLKLSLEWSRLRSFLEQGDADYVNDIYSIGDIKIDYIPDLKLAMRLDKNQPFGDEYAYRMLLEEHKHSVEKIQKFSKINYVPIPPITSLVLDIAKNVEDIPRAMMYVREEYSEIREISTSFRRNLDQANTLNDEIEIIESYLSSESALARKLKSQNTKSIVRFVFDLVKSASLTKVTTDILDSALNYDEQRLSLNRVHRYGDLYNQVLSSRKSQTNINRLFGDINFSSSDINNVKKLFGHQ